MAPVPDGFQRLVSVREFCQWRLAALASEAPEALAHYRSLADPLAEQWLAEAVDKRDERLLRRLVDEAFATTSGDDALLRLGDAALARGEYAEARGYYGRIGPHLRATTEGATERFAEAFPDTDLPVAEVRARLVLASILGGEHERAQIELELFRRLHAEAQGKLAGRDGNLAETLTALLTQARSWPPMKRTADWPTFAGDFSRSGRTSGPIDPAGTALWTFSLPKLATDRDVIDLGRLRVADDRKGLLSYHPVVVGDTVLVRVDARQRSYITALGLRDGQKRWQVDGHRGPEILTGAPDDPDAAWEVSDAHAELPRQVGVARYTLTTCGQKLFARMGSPVTAPPANRVEKLLSKSQG
ncbi:MAG: hypothetical protein WEH44_02580, partial [Pirellulaceae bacterium]